MASRQGTYSLLQEDLNRLDALQKRLAREGEIVHVSEIVRMGLLALEAASDTNLKRLLANLPRRRRGRAPIDADSAEPPPTPPRAKQSTKRRG